MREIPKLQVLCLRAGGEPSQASQLLRKFHQRAAAVAVEEDTARPETIHDIPLRRTVCVGQGASRRANSNDVDLNHPLVAHRDAGSAALVLEHGTPALNCLQSCIDSLVELGRMDDARLGVHFFEEWKAKVLMAAGKEVPLKKVVVQEEEEEDDDDRPRKRTCRQNHHESTKLSIRVTKGPPPPLGALSLNSCAIAEETTEAMRDSGMGPHLGVLDLTGIYGLNDPQLELLLPHCPDLTRLSLKNCRRVTEEEEEKEF